LVWLYVIPIRCDFPDVEQVPAPTDVEYHPDCASVGPGCGCTKADDRRINEGSPFDYKGYHFIKDSTMPITTAALKESVIAL